VCKGWYQTSIEKKIPQRYMMYVRCWNCINDIEISNQIKDALRRGHESGYDVGYYVGIKDAMVGERIDHQLSE